MTQAQAQEIVNFILFLKAIGIIATAISVAALPLAIYCIWKTIKKTREMEKRIDEDRAKRAEKSHNLGAFSL